MLSKLGQQMELFSQRYTSRFILIPCLYSSEFKLTILLGILTVGAKGTAQEITYTGKNVSITEAFAAIEKQSGYTFFYRTEILRSTKPLSLVLEKVPLEVALTQLFSKQPLSYSIEGRTIFVAKRNTPTSFRTNLPNTNDAKSTLVLAYPEVHGRVVDSVGNPLQGASVRVLNAEGKRTTLQTKTDG